jgi:hypothetical protein
MKGKTNWKKVKAMTEEEIEANALSDSDSQPLPDNFWEDATIVYPDNENQKKMQQKFELS